jgi:hypothetical protein
VDYAELLPSMFKMNAGYFLMQLASEKDNQRVCKLCGQYSRADADGVAQVCFIGVIDPLNPPVETAEEGLLASPHLPTAPLGSTDDCGFSPFSVHVKPNHGSPDLAHEIAFQKIASRVKRHANGFAETRRWCGYQGCLGEILTCEMCSLPVLNRFAGTPTSAARGRLAEEAPQFAKLSHNRKARGSVFSLGPQGGE